VLQRLAKPYNRSIIAKFENDGQSILFFSLRWLLVWFADDYRLPAILPLWDVIISHKDNYNDFMDALCIAHIAQITDSSSSVGMIQAKRNWDSQKAVAIAEQILRTRRCKDNFWTVPLIVMVAVFMLARFLRLAIY
jgi:hypothetical protein